MAKHTPGYVSMRRWDAEDGEALIKFGQPSPGKTTTWSTQMYCGFPSKEDAAEFVRRWNAFPRMLEFIQGIAAAEHLDDMGDAREDARDLLALLEERPCPPP